MPSLCYQGRCIHAVLVCVAAVACAASDSEQTCGTGNDCVDKPGRAMLQSSKGLIDAPAHLQLGSTPLKKQLPTNPPNVSQVMTFTDVTCGQTLFAPTGKCPVDCPYFAEESGADLACHFRCVKAAECGALIKNQNVPDESIMSCRKCVVQGCDTCVPAANGKGVDKCASCALGYTMTGDGECEGPFNVKTWSVIFGIIGIVAALLGSWYVHLKFCREAVNLEGEAEGLAYRSRAKLRDDKGELWPLSTSLHDTVVAGVGLLLHFDFQGALIVWGSIIVAGWIMFAYSTEPELLLLGLMAAESPHELCAVTLHGKKRQREMMWAKVLFVVLAYLFSFLGSLFYVWFHMKRFSAIDGDTTSMRDFAVLCSGGLSTLDPDRLEERLSSALKQSIGQNASIVGVSVCWDFEANADAVKAAAYKLTEEKLVEKHASWLSSLTHSNPKLVSTATEATPTYASCGVGLFDKIDGIFGFGPDAVPQEEETAGDENEPIENIVKGLKATDHAFVVFESEAARDAAVEMSRTGCLTMEGTNLTLEAVENEPDTVCWETFNVPSSAFTSRCAMGVGAVLTGVILWCSLFYLPYAYFISSFSAAQGEEAGFLTGFLFSMLVVGGNQAMYFLCNTVAYRIGFRYTDDAEGFYIALYTFACFMNLAVDLALEIWLGYHAMVAADVRIADGSLLGSLTSYQEIFESYPVQRSIGKRLYDYCFPATFLIPFCVEPLGAYYAPYHIQRLLLRAHAGVRGREAEKSMEFFTPMDLSRNGDIVLNVVLASLVFFFPAGESLKLILALVVCHCGIYMYDKYRVLRAVPAVVFAGCSADEISAGIMAVPCGFMAACIVFKGNCENGSPFCTRSEPKLLFLCLAAFFGHVTLHLGLQFYVLPGLRPNDKDISEDKYEDAAAITASTWFTANPVHKLRAEYKMQGVTIPACDGRDVKHAHMKAVAEDFEY